MLPRVPTAHASQLGLQFWGAAIAWIEPAFPLRPPPHPGPSAGTTVPVTASPRLLCLVLCLKTLTVPDLSFRAASPSLGLCDTFLMTRPGDEFWGEPHRGGYPSRHVSGCALPPRRPLVTSALTAAWRGSAGRGSAGRASCEVSRPWPCSAVGSAPPCPVHLQAGARGGAG